MRAYCETGEPRNGGPGAGYQATAQLARGDAPRGVAPPLPTQSERGGGLLPAKRPCGCAPPPGVGCALRVPCEGPDPIHSIEKRPESGQPFYEGIRTWLSSSIQLQ